MEKQLSVLLYSKYSPNSKRLLELIKEVPYDFLTKANINLFCIDNHEIRKRVIKSTKLEINIVPCILNVYSDGGVEKYDGENAFKWIEEIMRQLNPGPSPEQQELLRQQELIQKQQEELMRQKENQKNKPKDKDTLTSIEELESESEEEIPIQNRPKAVIRSDAGNYNSKGDFGEIEEPNRNVTRGIKKSIEPVAKGDLMTAALEMQKSRELEDSKTKKVGNN